MYKYIELYIYILKYNINHKWNYFEINPN